MDTPIFPTKLMGIAWDYLALLGKWGAVHSLTAIPAESRFEALLLDSAALLPHLETLPAGSLVADFGSGMGVPALVIAAHMPEINVVAIDSRRKKAAFVRQAALELGLGNLRALCGRAEELPPLGARAGTAKAAGPLGALLGWWARHSAAGAPFYAFLGPSRDTRGIAPDWDCEESPYALPTMGVRAIARFVRPPNP